MKIYDPFMNRNTVHERDSTSEPHIILIARVVHRTKKHRFVLQTMARDAAEFTEAGIVTHDVVGARARAKSKL
jgi:hypothetical protein